MLSHDELVELARFCANQARTATEKVVRARAWRLAVPIPGGRRKARGATGYWRDTL